MTSELQRVADAVPPGLQGVGADAKRLAPVLPDFRVFREAGGVDAVANTQVLIDLDEESMELHGKFTRRTYRMLSAIQKYYADLCAFLDDLDRGRFANHNLEEVLRDENGKQLLPEAVASLGAMLLLLDERMPGLVRERTLVLFYRITVGSPDEPHNFGMICKLFQDTKRPQDDQLISRPPGYPEKYFERFELPREIVRILIGHLQTHDIYGAAQHYSLAEHRSHSLSAQAGLLFTTLFFDVSTLESESATMREIVNRYFGDAWVIAYALGFTADLMAMWAPYAAAKQAMGATITQQHVKQVMDRHVQRLNESKKQMDGYLLEGALTEDRVILETSPLLSCLRQANTTIRWLLLQPTTLDTKLQAVFRGGLMPKEQLLQALVEVAVLEDRVHSILAPLVGRRAASLVEQRATAASNMDDLAVYFSGEHPLVRHVRNDDLCAWFRDKQKLIEALNFDNQDEALALGRKVAALVRALKQIQDYHEVSQQQQCLHFINDACALLESMVRTVNLSEGTLETIRVVADLSYAWKALGAYEQTMYALLAKSPDSVKGLRALFLKLASILQVPLHRIRQAKNQAHYELVSGYYSSRLEQFMSSTLQEIPRLHFGLLAEIVERAAAKPGALGSRMNLTELHEYAVRSQQARGEVALLSQRVALFMRGIWETEVAVLGAVRVEPRTVLLDGLRRELACRIEQLLAGLTFSATGRGGAMTRQDFVGPVEVLMRKSQALRSGLEHVQDYLGVSALQLWNQELFRVIGFLLQAEQYLLLRKRLPPLTSIPQHDPKSPITVVPSVGNASFISRTANAMQALTEAKTVVGGNCSDWQVASSGEVQLDGHVVEVLYQSLGQPGFAAICKYLGFLVCGWMRKVYMYLEKQIPHEVRFTLVRLMSSDTSGGGGEEVAATYRAAAHQFSSTSIPMMDVLAEAGRIQLLRRRFIGHLRLNAQLQVPVALDAFRALDGAGLMEAEAVAENDAEALPSVAADGEDGPTLEELVNHFHRRLASASTDFGLSDPLRHFYRMIPDGMPVEGVDALLACGIITACRNNLKATGGGSAAVAAGGGTAPRERKRDRWFGRSATSAPAVGTTEEHSDGNSAASTAGEQLAAVAAGIATLLQQLPKASTDGLLTLIGIYLGGLCQEKPTSKEHPMVEGAHLIDFAETLLDFLGIAREHLASFVPQGLLDLWFVN